MANSKEALRKNVEGRYFVDDSCIYCDSCVETAPTVIGMIGEGEWAYVRNQTETEEEHELAFESLEGCPTQSIGDRENPGLELKLSTPAEKNRSTSKRWFEFWRRNC